MASIGGLSSGTSNSIYGGGGKGISGLASGLDTDSIIEGMTLGTKTKIIRQQQEKQLLKWMTEDFRAINSKIIGLKDKFMSYTSSTNLRSPGFFDKNLISAIGSNSKYVTVSGKSPSADKIQIAAVEQLAQNTSYVSNNTVSNATLTGEEINLNEKVETSQFVGKTLSFKYNNKDYSITLPADGKYGSVEEINETIKAELDKVDAGNDKKLSDIVDIKIGDDSKFSISIKDNRDDTAIKDLDGTLLSFVGIDKSSTVSGAGNSIKGSVNIDQGFIDSSKDIASFAEKIAGKSITFTYNGTSKTIKLPALDNSDVYTKGPDGSYSINKEKLKENLQSEVDKAFGKGKINVNFQDGESGKTKLSITAVESTSVLKITGGSTEALNALGLKQGQSNRLNLGTSVANSGIKELGEVQDYAIHIQNSAGEIITIDKTVNGKKFDANTSLAEIIKAVNESDAGVTISYMETADKFSITAKEGGANSDFSIVDKDGGTSLGSALFGSEKYNKTEGKNAIVWVDFDGDGGAPAQKIERSSNSFDIDGLTISVNGTFGMKQDEHGQMVVDPASEPVRFDAKVDSEKIVKAVKEMIDAYNEIIELTNGKLTEKRNRDYKPLTEEQKKEMSEEEIKNWEKKAREGLLFNNPELRGFTSEIRFIFSGTSDTINILKEMGIETSSEYKENGKIKFDEEKFKQALEKNPETVKKMFTSTEQTFTDENGNEVKIKGGIMEQMSKVFDKYSSTTGYPKGVFVELAGANESPLSVANNSMQKKIDNIDKEIKRFERQLKIEKERYQRQFTALETFISNMNSQSAWLAQQFAG